MRRYIVDLQLTRGQVLSFYQGAARAVVAPARSGERVQFPLDALRPHVDADGISGTFLLMVDSRQRLLGIERLC